jgi:hypothetical protein
MKPRRDITLGEMQDECKRYWNNGNLGSCGKCQYMEVCCHYEDYAPARLNLTDPPRFNEAQMAFWKGLYELGVNFVKMADDGWLLRMAPSRNADNCSAMMVIIGIQIGLEKEEELDLAELLGKDAT